MTIKAKIVQGTLIEYDACSGARLARVLSGPDSDEEYRVRLEPHGGYLYVRTTDIIKIYAPPPAAEGQQ